MANRLLEPLLENGIRNTNYFNGRILNAADLQADQQANRFHNWQLGRALGEGVVYGLEVTVDPKVTAGKTPILNVRAGLAINRQGQMMELRVGDAGSGECPPPAPSGVEPVISLELTDIPSVVGSSDAGLFGACTPGTASASVPLTGVYVLAIAPASGFRERAPMKSLSLTGKDTGCGSRWAVEGVVFRLAPFPDPSAYPDSAAYAPITDLSDLRLQNRLAHLCFGTEKLLQAGPFAPPAEYGALDAMRSLGLLTDCDTPLALVYLSGGAIQFCDMWAARRSIVPLLAEQTAPLAVGHRRLSEAVALFRQFQSQMEQLKKELSTAQFAALNVADRFRFLPPGGYLTGLTPDTFFAPFRLPVNRLHPYTLDPSEFRLLLAQSWLLDPIDLTRPLPDLNLYADAGGKYLFVRGDHSQPVPVTPPTPNPGAIQGVVQLALPLLEISREQIAAAPLQEALQAQQKQAAEILTGLTLTATSADGSTHTGVTASPQFGQEGTDGIITFVQISVSIRFDFKDLPPDRYVVQAQGKTLYGERTNVRVLSEQTTQIFFPIFREEPIEEQ